MAVIKEKIAYLTVEILLETGAVAICSPGDDFFTLKSGNRSPIYINCRRLLGFPSHFNMVCSFLHYHAQGWLSEIDVIVGGESAGMPYADRLAQLTGKPYGYVRKAAKGYGTDQQVEGAIRPNQRYLLVEDLITDGGSKLAFIKAIQDAEGWVNRCLVVFDREQGGAKELQSNKIELVSLTNMATLISSFHRNHARQDLLMEYHQDPKKWHENRGLSYKE